MNAMRRLFFVLIFLSSSWNPSLHSSEKILIVGTGYVGLITGTCLAEIGNTVICLDIDQKKIDNLQKVTVPFFEPGIEELVKSNISSGRLIFTTDYASAVTASDICFLALPTPQNDNGSCNLDYLKASVKQIAAHMNHPLILVNKSTAIVGTTKELGALLHTELAKRGKDLPFDIANNPEFLREGSAIHDFMFPDRIVIGVENTTVEQKLVSLYQPFANRSKIVIMDIPSAEMTKYAANSMLAARISFINELSNLCERVGADITQVSKGVGLDKRIGPSFLNAGLGYGGSCLPKDVKALKSFAAQWGCQAKMLEAIDAVNEEQKKLLGQKICDYYSSRGGLKGKVIGIWGLAFKPNTDDMRYAPSLVVIDRLLKEGAVVKVYDPEAMQTFSHVMPSNAQLKLCASAKEAAAETDALVLVTEWEEFQRTPLSDVLKTMKGRAFFDGRNQFNPSEMNHLGFHYISMGKLPRN
jgi:UDPglucose 6-dehydrogenase